tara:strand:- start:13399 stop:13779 length:381 start_codon:yes stop_codon:yes gene_type:complete
MIKVTIPIYFKATKKKTVLLGLNWYRNSHYAVQDKAKKFISSVVEDTIEGEPILEGRIHADFKIYLKRKGTDGGNVRAVAEKFGLDAIKNAGYIIDDNAEIIRSDASEYFYDKEFPRAEITLTRKL